MQLNRKNVFGCIMNLTIGLSHGRAQGLEGYFQYPDLHQNTNAFTSEGDLWKVSVVVGLDQRLTTLAEEERFQRFLLMGRLSLIMLITKVFQKYTPGPYTAK